MYSLKQIQQDFASTMRQGGDASNDLLSSIVETSLSPDARLNIHRNNYKFSLTDTVVNKFPKVEAFVGRDFLEQVARAYVANTTPTDSRFSEYGDDFSDFWAAFPHTQQLPYIADLIRLEWLVDKVQEEVHVDPVMEDVWVKLSATGQGDDVKVDFVPQYRILDSDYPLFSLWLAATGQIPAETVSIDYPGHTLLIIGKSGQVNIAVLSKSENSFLAELKQGATFSQAMHETTLKLGQGFNLAEIIQQNALRGLFKRAYI